MRGFYELEGAVVFVDAHEGKIESVIDRVRVREVDRAEHEQGAVPPVFVKFRDFAKRPVVADVPDRSNVLGLAGSILGGSRKKKFVTELH